MHWLDRTPSSAVLFLGLMLLGGIATGQLLAACSLKCQPDVEWFYTGETSMGPGDYYAILDGQAPTGRCTRVWRTSNPDEDYANTTQVPRQYRKFVNGQCNWNCLSNGGVHGVASCDEESGTLQGDPVAITCYSGCTDEPPEG